MLLNSAKKAVKFVVGSTIIKRSDGWPMGGFLSAAATAITLDHDVSMTYRYPERAKRLGWYYANWKTESIIQGVLHVDDSCVFFKINLLEMHQRRDGKSGPKMLE